MALRLDRSSPVPLFHQIVQAIRWQIGTGALRPGDPLPPVRQAAELWQVNYHTVRRAYRELTAQGWLSSLQGSGTHVGTAAPHDGNGSDAELEAWLDDVIAAGRERYGLTPAKLGQAIGERARVLRVVMVECNMHQSRFLAEQLQEAWGAEAVPWPLESAEPPPRLPIIGTYFHHAEMRHRWPDRIEDMHFVTLYLDPTLQERVERAAPPRRRRVVAHLVERDPATALEMAAGVSALLSPRFEVRPTVADPDEALRALPEDELLLIAPRLWDDLQPSTREHARVFDVRHLIVPDEMQRLRRSVARAARRKRKGRSTAR